MRLQRHPDSTTTQKQRFSIAVLLAALLGLGISWSFASPHGSSADDDFHLTKIWCSWGESEYCQDAGDQQGVFVPRTVAFPSCYVNWPSSVSASCTNELNYDVVYTTRYDFGNQYPGLFHRVMGLMAGKDVVASVQLMRIFNVVLATILLGAALLLVRPVIRRALAVSWGIGLVPVGIFFIASTNASSWVIIGIGIFWAVLLSLVRTGVRRDANSILQLMLLVVLVLLVLGARRDGGLYLSAVAVATVIVGLKGRPRSPIAIGGVVAIVLALSVTFLVRGFSWIGDIWQTVITSIPGAQTATDQPNPILKTLLEVPSFVAGLWGGQRPSFIMSDSGFRQGVDGYRPVGFAYGLGWTDFALPSIVGVLALVAAVTVMSAGFNSYQRRRVVAFLLLLLALVTQVMMMRVVSNFTAEWSVQPRFVFPYVLPLAGIALLAHRRRLLSNFQALVASFSVAIAGAFAWLATASRYAVGPDAAFTNFGQAADWWWSTGPSRLVWFILASVATAAWVYATIWRFGTAPLLLNARSVARTSLHE